MRVAYLDAALATNNGHHTNSARAILGELHQRHIEVDCHAHQSITDEVAGELHARKTFSIQTYSMKTSDRVVGWLDGFFLAYNEITQELINQVKVSADDIVYYNSAQPPQLQA